MRKLGIAVWVLIPILAAACTPEGNQNAQTDQQRRCIARLYSDYNPKQLDQCMGACKACMGGNTVTCSTSCKLKGAS